MATTSVSVDLTRWDLVRLSLFALPRNTVFRSALVGIGVFIVVTLVRRRGLPANDKDVVVILLTLLLFVSGAAAFMLLLNAITIVLSSTERSGVLGRHEYTIREDGLFEVTGANETLIKWGGAQGLYRRKSCLCVQVAPSLYHVLPRRCFSSDAAYEEFWMALQRLPRSRR